MAASAFDAARAVDEALRLEAERKRAPVAAPALPAPPRITAPDNVRPILESAASRHGVPADELALLARQESNFNPRAVNRESGADGMFQQHPPAHPNYRVGTGDAAYQTDYAAAEYAKLRARYAGDPEKATTAWFGGPGTVDKAIAAGGENWQSALPPRTAQYNRETNARRGVVEPSTIAPRLPAPPTVADDGLPTFEAPTIEPGQASAAPPRAALPELPAPPPVTPEQRAVMAQRVDKLIADQGAGRARTAVSSFVEAVGEGIAAVPEAFSEIRSGLHQMGAMSDPGPRDKQTGIKIGQAIREAFDQPVNPKYAQEFWTAKVPAGLGSTVTFLAGGAAGRVLAAGGKVAKIAGGLLGASSLGALTQGAVGANDAAAHDADAATRWQAFLANAGLGLTEGIPIARVLNRLDKGSGGHLSRILKEGLKGSFEEALQEGIQNAGSNAIAAALYDADRAILEQVPEGTAVGGVVGFTLSALATALGGKHRPGPAEAAVSSVTHATPEGQPPPSAVGPAGPATTAAGPTGEAPARGEGGKPETAPPAAPSVQRPTDEAISGPGLFGQDETDELPRPLQETHDGQQSGSGRPAADAQPPRVAETERGKAGVPGASETAAAAAPAGAAAAPEVATPPKETSDERQRGLLPTGDEGQQGRPTEGAGAAGRPEAPATTDVLTSKPKVAENVQRVVGARGTAVDTEYEVVDLKTLKAANGNLQPRNRATDTGYEAQIHRMSTAFEPAKVGRSPEADKGAPIVGPDDVVESGNARRAALERVYAGQPESAAAYRKMIESEGFKVPEGVERPVLIRRRLSGMSEQARQRWVDEANESGLAAVTSDERSRMDRKVVTPALLRSYNPNADLTSSANQKFISDFAKAAGADSREFFQDGALTQQGLSRVKGALLSSAYGGTTESDAIVRDVVTNVDPEIGKQLADNLTSFAPQFLELRSRVADGMADKSAAAAGEKVAAAVQYINAERSAGRNPLGNIDQADLIKGARDPDVTAIARSFLNDAGTAIRGKREIRDYLQNLTDAARERVPLSQAIERAGQQAKGAYTPPEQGGIFDLPRPGAAAAGPALPGPPGTSTAIDQQAQAAATSTQNDLPQPTPAQREAENFPMGHAKPQGIDVTIQYPAGSTRTNKPGQTPWSVQMTHHYGHIKRTVGNDGDPVDVLMGPEPENESLPVVIIDQGKKNGQEFDEHKVMLGFKDRAAAIAGYKTMFSGAAVERMSANMFGIRELPPAAFKQWLAESNKKQPAMDWAPQGETRDGPVKRLDQIMTMAEKVNAAAAADLRNAASALRNEGAAAAAPHFAAASQKLYAQHPQIAETVDSVSEQFAQQVATAPTTKGAPTSTGEIPGISPERPRYTPNKVGVIEDADEIDVGGGTRREYAKIRVAPVGDGWVVGWDVQLPDRGSASPPKANGEKYVSREAAIAAAKKRIESALQGAIKDGSEAVKKVARPMLAKLEAAGVEASAPTAVEKPAVVVKPNTIFTEDRAAKAREILRKKLGQINAGFDPELMAAGLDLAGYHIERGARTFAAYAEAMIADLGEAVRPYLKSWYMAVRYDPRAADFQGEMSTAADVEAASAEAVDVQQPSTAPILEAGAPDEPAADSGAGEGTLADGVPAGVRDADRGEPVGEGSDSGRDADARGNADADGGRGDGTGGVGSQPAPVRDDGSDTPAVTDEPPAWADYEITDDDALGTGTPGERIRANIEAIRLVKKLDAEDRYATYAEKRVLVKYIGWGGLKRVFDPNSPSPQERQARADLEQLLTREEYFEARQSVLNAFYTSPPIIRGMYRFAEHFGFKGGNVLEPTSGTGNFIGLMPAGMKGASSWYASELDPITGRIAKYLYPESKILDGTGFQDAEFSYGKFDMAIGNPPFGDERITDKRREDISGLKIHNYVIAKAGKHLRPGGIMQMVVTSRFLDASNPEGRNLLAKDFRFLGAVRLPSEAFKGFAGTEVTTDIIFLQKRLPGGPDGTADWQTTDATMTNAAGEEVTLNQYFAKRPELMLGEPSMRGTMYAGHRGNEFTLTERDGQDTEALLGELVDSEHFEDLRNVLNDKPAIELGSDIVINKVDVPVGGYWLDGETVYMREDDDDAGNSTYTILKPETQWTEKTKLGAGRLDRIRGMLRIRDAAYELMRLERADAPVGEIDAARKALNKLYDGFVARNGLLNDQSNSSLIDDKRIEFGLEREYQKAVTPAVAKRTGQAVRASRAQKSSLLTERVFHPYKEITSAANVKDGYNISLSEKGKLDIPYIATLTGKTEAQVQEDLAADNLAFQDPDTKEWMQEDLYLSGNVKAKLRLAKATAGMERNVAALEKVIPADVKSEDIYADLGSTWIPAKVYEDFAHVIGISDAKVAIQTATGRVSILSGSVRSNEINTEWRNQDYTLDALFNALANKQALVAWDRMEDGSRMLNRERTLALRPIGRAFRQFFQDWIFADGGRAQEVAKVYNDTQNTHAPRQYRGELLKTVGANPSIDLRDSQRNAAWRMIQSPVVLLDHVVGAGKTFTLITGIMERKRLGLTRKPMVVVPNHLVNQWARDWATMYPGAHVLAATEKDFARQNRRRLFARIATGKFDGIIVGHSSFEFIPLLPKTETDFIMEEISFLERALAEAETVKDRRSVRTITNRISKKKERIDRLLSSPRDKVATLEEMGVDYLAVDEFHKYKNLEYSTSMQNVVGMGDPLGARKSFDMYSKIQYLIGAGGGIAPATGTPVSNSLVEMYTVLRYLNRQGLKERDQEIFDAWAKTYASIDQKIEYTATGKLKERTVFGSFNNLPELMQLYGGIADVITMRDLKRIYSEQIERRNAATGRNDRTEFPVPKVKGGGRVLDAAAPSAEQREYMDYLVARAKATETGGKDYAAIDNALWIISDAKKMALDIRIVDPSAPDHPGSKAARASQKIKEIYDRTKDVRGTQLVFCDLSTPSGTAEADAKRFLKLAMRVLGDPPDVASRLESLNYVQQWRLIHDKMIERMEDPFAEDKARDQIRDFIEEWDTKGESAVNTATSGFSVYDDIKQKLMAMGVPEKEIRYIHEANTRDQKQELFDLVNAGTVRVMIGSTEKMGAGTNVQKRVVAEHHMDSPWKPAEIEQREGRVIRQGNEFYEQDPDGFEVEIYAYSTKNTFDAVMWQTLQRKAEGLEQFRYGLRTMVEGEGDAKSYAEFMAESTGNTAFKDKFRLEQELAELVATKNKAKAQVSSAKQTIERGPTNLASAQASVDRYAAVAAELGDDIVFEYRGESYTYDATAALHDENIAYEAERKVYDEAYEQFIVAREAWEKQPVGKRGKSPAKPVEPERPTLVSKRMAEKSRFSKFVRDLIQDFVIRINQKPDADVEFRLGDDLTGRLIANPFKGSAEVEWIIEIDKPGHGPTTPFRRVSRLMPGIQIAEELTPAHLRMNTNIYQQRWTDERERIAESIKTAQRIVEGGAFKHEERLQEVQKEYQKVLRQVERIEIREAMRRASKPNRYIAGDTRRPLGEFGQVEGWSWGSRVLVDGKEGNVIGAVEAAEPDPVQAVLLSSNDLVKPPVVDIEPDPNAEKFDPKQPGNANALAADLKKRASIHSGEYAAIPESEQTGFKIISGAGKAVYQRVKELGERDIAKLMTPEARVAFKETGDTQRGDPELHMVATQKLLGGGVLSWSLEHVGDLSHRMSQIADGLYAYDSTMEKVDKTLRTLERPYGFEREHLENMESNYKMRLEDVLTGKVERLPRDQHDARIKKALDRYAELHETVPVWNAAQWHARQAAIALGRGNYAEATASLRWIKSHMDRPSDFIREATQFDGKPYVPPAVAARPLPVTGRSILKDVAADMQARTTDLAELQPLRGGMPASQVRRAVADLIERVGNVVDVQIVQRDHQIHGGLGGQPFGTPAVHWLGTNRVALISDHIRSPAHAREAMAHEVYGHLAVEHFVDMQAFQDGVKALRKSTSEATREAREIWNSVAELYADEDEDTQAKEVIAFMAQRGFQHSLMDALIAAVKRGLRRLGLTLEFTDKEIRAIIASAARRLNAIAAQRVKEPATRQVESNRPVDVAAKRAVYQRTNPGTERQAQEATTEGLKAGVSLDSLVRLPFRMLGLVNEKGEFGLGAKASAKLAEYIQNAKFADTGNFKWINPVLERARWGLLDQFGVPQSVRDQSDRAQSRKRGLQLQGLQFVDEISKMAGTLEEAKILQDMLAGETLDDDRFGALPHHIRAAIEQLSLTAVDLGLISRESYERNKGTYLHRVYMDKELGQFDGTIAKWMSSLTRGRRHRIRGDELKGRGVFWEVTPQRLMRDMDMTGTDLPGRGVKMQKDTPDASFLGRKFRVIDMTKVKGEEQPEFPGMPPAKQREKVVKRIYWPLETPLPRRYFDGVDRGTFAVRRVEGSKYVLWRDFTKEERDQMGEILDARYTVAKTFQVLANDIASGEYFRDLANNPEATWQDKEAPPPADSIAKPGSSMMATIGYEWTQVPASAISETGNKKKWGDLAGKYVKVEVWKDLLEYDRMNKQGPWQKILDQWKLNKTARNPVVHMNNFIANLALADLIDVRWRDLLEGFHEFVDKGEVYRQAEEYGLFGHGYVDAEMHQHLKKILAEISREARADGFKGFTGKLAFFDRFAGVVSRAAGALGKADAAMLHAYGASDDIFRMGAFIRGLRQGLTPQEAATRGRDEFLNYTIRAPWINAARRSVLPFLAYTYRAVPVIADAVMRRPWKIAKYALLAELANVLAYAVSGGDEDDERNHLMEQDRGRTWMGGAPYMMRLPFNDEHGRAMFMDIRRWIPSGDVFDQNQSMALPIPAWLQFGGPLMIASEIVLNRAGFTGQDIVNPLTDDLGDKGQKYATHVWRSWAPSAPWIYESWYYERVSNSIGGRDTLGRPLSTTQALASSAGVKVRPVDVKLNAKYLNDEYKRTISALRAEARRAGRMHARGLLSDGDLADIQTEIRDKMEALGEKYSEQ